MKSDQFSGIPYDIETSNAFVLIFELRNRKDRWVVYLNRVDITVVFLCLHFRLMALFILSRVSQSM